MSHEACPRCGGHAQVETETWTSLDHGLTRQLRCDSCGDRFEVRSGTGVSPPWSSRASGTRHLAAIPLLMLALWLALRLLPYAGRAQLYSGVSTFLEAYRNPAWAAVMCASAAALLTLGRRRARWGGASVRQLADVHVRVESDGRLAVLLPGEFGAVGRDFLIRRTEAEERAIVERLASLAERSVAFGHSASATRADQGELQREIYSLGLSLADALLGRDEELRDRLFDLPGEHLLLRIQPSLVGLPWELMVTRPGAQFLWQRFHVGRQVRDGSEAPRPATRGRGPMRMLVLANLEAGVDGRDLPAAEAEAQELLELAALESESLRAVRRSPRTEHELRRSLSEGFDLVHFAGHTTDARGEPGWVMADGRAVDPSVAVEECGHPPVLLFANACRSGPGARVSTWSSDAPRRLMTAGVASYVGTLWELEDARAAGFSRVFYKNLISGRTIGESLTAARSSQLGVSSLTWANYVLYGDPSARLHDRI